MNTHNIYFHDKILNSPNISLNISFIELSDEFPLRKNEFELAI